MNVYETMRRANGKLSATEQFLTSLSNAHTKASYKRGLELFQKFVGRPIEEIIEQRKEDLTPKPNESIVDAKLRAERFEGQLLEPFFFDLLKEKFDRKAFKASSAAKNCDGILRLLAYYAMPVTLRNGSPITEGTRQVGIKRFPLKIEDLRKMFHAEKSLMFKLIISLGLDFPARIQDFLSIQVDELPDLNQEPPIEFMRLSTKENQLQKSCLSPLTVSLLKEYLKIYNPKTWLFFSLGKDPNKQLSDESVNRELRRLASACHIQVKPYSISWHCFRDLVLSTGKTVGIDPDALKLITGKAVSRSMLPYLKTMDIKKPFMELQKIIRIDGELLLERNDTVAQLKRQVETLQKQVQEQQTFIKFLTLAYGKNIEEQALKMMREGQLSQEEFRKVIKMSIEKD